MKKYILHIGRHKTGTSSVQRFLYANRPVLPQYGYYYPETGLSKIAHHEIATFFCKKYRCPGNQERFSELSRKVKALFAEIANQDQVVILSSEAFQNCSPRLLAEKFVPEETKIIVYIREQVDYLISAYQQMVHAKKYYLSLDEAASKLAINYDSSLSLWEKFYGPENIEVRIYDRNSLKAGDIVMDFMDILDIGQDANLKIPLADQNPSIGGVLLEFKRLLNFCTKQATPNKWGYQLLSMIAAKNPSFRIKPVLKPELVEAIRNSSRESNQRIFDRYFGGVDVFQYREFQESQEYQLTLADLIGVLEAAYSQETKFTTEVMGYLMATSDGVADKSERDQALAYLAIRVVFPKR